ncbi:MAG: NAD(P)-dependent oxidoreductase [Planctomycetota bacterium]|nr:NAD(P)-dependent oxidoreductase [Planctomycetota bacterium]
MRYFITGATGFVGRNVTSALASENAEIATFVRNKAKAEKQNLSTAGIKLFVGDLADTHSLDLALKAFKPHTIIHLGWSGVTAADRNHPNQIDNLNSTFLLAELAIKQGAQAFIGLGSQAEYGPKQGVIDESALCEPNSMYGACKLASFHTVQQLCQIHGIRFSWLRLFSCYGPNDTRTFLIPSVIEALLNRCPPSLTAGSQIWDYLYVADAADAIVRIAKSSDITGVFNLGSGIGVPIKTIIEQLRDLVDKDLPLKFGEVPYGPNSTMHLQADISKLISVGWRPKTSLADGLKTTIDWHRIAKKI